MKPETKYYKSPLWAICLVALLYTAQVVLLTLKLSGGTSSSWWVILMPLIMCVGWLFSGFFAAIFYCSGEAFRNARKP